MSGQARDYRQSQLFGGPDTRPAFQRVEDDVGQLVAGNFTIRTVFTSQTILLTDVAVVVSGFSTVKLTLPTVSGNTQKWYAVKNAQAQAVTVACIGIDTIDGSATISLAAGAGVFLWNDGLMWRRFAAMGVTSIAKQGSTPLVGDVTLTGSGLVTLTELGQNIDIGATLPLTTKGDVLGYSTLLARIPIGTNGQVLTADSTQTLGLKWATPAASPLTTKGDIYTYASADARLPVGSDGQVLTADAASTNGIKWATATASALPTNILVISPGAASITWVVPSAVTEFNGSKIYEAAFDLTSFTSVRIMVSLAAAPANTPKLYGQYSTDSGSTWNYLDGGTGPNVTPSAGGVNASGWVSLASGAKADVWLRIVGNDAGGPAASSFGAIYLQAK